MESVFPTDVSNGYIGECYLSNSADSLEPDEGETLTFICVKDFVQIDMFDLSATSRISVLILNAIDITAEGTISSGKKINDFECITQ